MESKMLIEIISRVAKLKDMIPRLQSAVARSNSLIASEKQEAVTAGLISLGLTKQAQQEITTACQNMGFGIEILIHLTTIDNQAKLMEIEAELPKAFKGVVTLISQKLKLNEAAVEKSLYIYVDEIYVVAEYTLKRAEDHIEMVNEEQKLEKNQTETASTVKQYSWAS